MAILPKSVNIKRIPSRNSVLGTVDSRGPKSVLTDNCGQVAFTRNYYALTATIAGNKYAGIFQAELLIN